ADRTLGIGGAARVRPDNSQAAVVDPEPGTVTGVRRLYPGGAPTEREVDRRESHTSVLHTDRVVTRVASFKINEVVRASGQDIWMSCIDCKRRLVLRVLRGGGRRTPTGDQGFSAEDDSHHCRCRNKRGCGRDARNGEETSSIKTMRSFHNS